MTASEITSPARARGVLEIVSPSQAWATPIDTSGSAAVMIASTGEIMVPAWKAFWLSRKPIGPRITTPYRGHCLSGSLKPRARVLGKIFSKNALTPKSIPQASASHSGRIRRGPQFAAARQPATTATNTSPSGTTVLKLTVLCPPLGRATTRKPATPAAQQMTPVDKTQSGRRRASIAANAAANIRSQTKIGWTSASAPKCSATICSTLPTMFTAIAASHSGRFKRSSRSRGESARRFGTSWVVRCSTTSERPNKTAAANATTTAIAGNILSQPSLMAGNASDVADYRLTVTLLTGLPTLSPVTPARRAASAGVAIWVAGGGPGQLWDVTRLAESRGRGAACAVRLRPGRPRCRPRGA
jgi:hypothetical protein